MYQVAKALLQDSQEYTTISLIYANLSEADILIKDELDKLAGTYARSGNKPAYAICVLQPGVVFLAGSDCHAELN